VLAITDEVAIDEAELVFRFSPSGGPGGQHANRSATCVTLVFDIAHSPSLGATERQRLLQHLASRLGGSGLLQIQVHQERSQSANRALAIERLRALLARGLAERRPRRPTRPPPEAAEARLAAKRRRAQTKAGRSRPTEPEHESS
jgi:ribosome-associated protein